MSMAHVSTRSRLAIARRLHFLAVAAFLCVFPTLVAPQALAAAPTPSAEVSPTPVGPADEYDRGTPRESMEGYLVASRDGDYERAAAYLDLSRIPESRRAKEGPKLARELKVVLDRELWVDLESLSDQPEGIQGEGLPPRRDLVGNIKMSKGSVPITLERVPRSDGVMIWKIAASTVAEIPTLYREFGPGALAEILPAPFFSIQFLDVQLWQWLGLLLLIVVAGFVSWVLTVAIVWVARKIVVRTRVSWDDTALDVTIGPLRLAIGAMLFAAGSYALGLAVPVQKTIVGVQQALLIAAFTWFLLRVVNLTATTVERYLIDRGQATATTVVPLGRRTLQVFILAVAILAMLQNFGFNITGVLAGLGIGGLAVALAAQKTLENLFGGITLIFDRPVRVGDFCKFGDRVGTVEDIGMRSTRVRTLDRTVVTVPNSEFAGMQLENFTKRDRIWLHPTIGLRYETTPDQLRWVLVEVKKMLLGHPRVSPDPARIRFTGFGAYSLDLDVFAYVLTSDYGEFLEIQEDIFLRIVDIVNASGTGFAFPSQTIYTGKDDGLDDEKSRAAEAQVEKWRKENALYLPNIPPEEAVKIQHTLDYPPKGQPAPKK